MIFDIEPLIELARTHQRLVNRLGLAVSDDQNLGPLRRTNEARRIRLVDLRREISCKLTALTSRSALPRCSNLNSKPTSSRLRCSAPQEHRNRARRVPPCSVFRGEIPPCPQRPPDSNGVREASVAGSADHPRYSREPAPTAFVFDPARQQILSRYRPAGSCSLGPPAVEQRARRIGLPRPSRSSSRGLPIRPLTRRPNSRHSRGGRCSGFSAAHLLLSSTVLIVRPALPKWKKRKPNTTSCPPSRAEFRGTSKSIEPRRLQFLRGEISHSPAAPRLPRRAAAASPAPRAALPPAAPGDDFHPQHGLAAPFAGGRHRSRKSSR